MGEQSATLKNKTTSESLPSRGPPTIAHLHVSWGAQ